MSASVKINNSYVSEKIARIRFLPENDEANKFLTGSWDSGTTNHLKLWEIANNEDFNEFSPVCLAKQGISADITGLELLGANLVCISSSDGSVSVFQTNSDRNNLRQVHLYGGLHKFQDNSEASCTGISLFEDNIASVGEDGALNILSVSTKSPVRQLSNVDSCSLTCVEFVNHKEVLIGNRMGIIKVVDVRVDDQKPTTTMAVSGEDEKKSNSVTSIASHPTQNHIILGGSEEGSITVFDLRQPLYPASYLTAHTSAICEIAFHRTEPSKLFTASENGEVWQWAQNMTPTLGLDYEPQMENMNPWLNSEKAKSKISVTSLITGIGKSINSIDSCRSKVICGSDNEAIYLIENMF